MISALLEQGGAWSTPASEDRSDSPQTSDTDDQPQEAITNGDPPADAKHSLIINNKKKLDYSLANERKDIGVVQRIHEQVPVIDSLRYLSTIDVSSGPRFFIKRSLVDVWNLHDRNNAGTPDVSDIQESIRLEGQQEPCKVRYHNSKLELVAGFRRSYAVSQVKGMYLLCDVYGIDQMPDIIAWKEMTSENDFDRKKAVPISAQVVSDNKAIEAGLFQNRAELSRAAGKNEAWSSNNLSLYNSIPELIREKAGHQLMATLSAQDYKKLGKLFKFQTEKRVSEALSIEDLFVGNTFPVAKICKLFSEVSAKEQIKKLSTEHLATKLDTNGNISISFKRDISKSQLKEILTIIEKELSKV